MVSKKIIVLTLLYVVICFIAIMIFSFVFAEIPTLLEIDIFSYTFHVGLSSFIEWLPSILSAVFFVIVATYIDKDGNRNIRSFSTIQMDNFKKIIVMISANVIVLFCATEIFLPLTNSAKLERENRIVDYNWYMERSLESYNQDDVLGALYYVDTALALYPSSQDALVLKEELERAPAETAAEELQYFPEISTTTSIDPLDSTTVLSMLEKARVSFENKNYFDAHYYAFIGLELGGVNNANSTELQKISLDSWNILETWSGFETDEDMRIFELKRQGYSALMEGDSLSAYYIYLDLHNTISHDPDVIRYYELSKNALSNEYFFIDETANLTHFEKAKNISFSVSRSDGLFYEVHIGGITNVRSAGEFLKYLRNYSCTVKNTAGNVLYSFTVPYVKLIGQPLTSLNDTVVGRLNLSEDDIVPRLLLTSVDRNTKGILSAPVFMQGESNPLDDSLTLLPMSLEDFELVVEASAGAKYINLASLYSFIPKAEQYGFSELVYSFHFLQRSCYPFLVFALLLFLAIQAWNYRLAEGSIFRFYWVLIVPIFTVVAEAIRLLVNYGMSLISLSFARLEGMWQIPAFIIVLLIIIVILSIRFLSLHTEKKIK